MSAAQTVRMRAVVLAYGEVGYAGLESLLEQGVEIPLVVTHEDLPTENCWFRSVHDLARRSGLAVIAPADVNAPEVIRAVAATHPEFLFSFYFRRMLGAELLRIPRRGCLNLHGSLLPRYRGRAPVNWVLVRGETETGVTLHYMDEKPDHGPIVGQRAVPIARDDTALRLTGKLAAAAHDLLREVVPLLAEGTALRIPQDHSRATYFGGRRPEDGEIDWREPAERIRDLVRAVTDPWPGAFSRLRSRKLMVWWAETNPETGHRQPGEIWLEADGAPWVETGDGSLALAIVSWEGETPVPGWSWARRESVRPGERFARGGKAGTRTEKPQRVRD